MHQWIILLYKIIHGTIVLLFCKIVYLSIIPVILTRLLTEIYNIIKKSRIFNVFIGEV